MKLILIRHGETQENADDITQGWIDTVINQTGQQQAQAAADSFDADIDMIYSSDLTRCRQTAQYFRDKFPELPYHEDHRLRERNFGDAQGTHKDLHDWEVFYASNDQVSIPNAETLDTFTARVKGFLDDIKANHSDDQQLLVVAHGGTINRILNILGISDHDQVIPNAVAMPIEMP